MPQPFITFDVMGDQQLVRGFSRFIDNIKDMSVAFRQMVPILRGAETQQFESEGQHGSGGWQPLAPATIARKQRGGHPLRILVRTRTLQHSLVDGSSHTISIIEPMQMRWGTKVRWASFHQTGTSKMPARPVIQLAESDKTELTKVVHKYLVQEAKNIGGVL